MKKLLFAILVCTCALFSYGQSENSKTILYLIPFYTEEISNIDPAIITSENDIYSELPFQLVGFWEGAKIAFDEFERAGIQLEVIVKDITYDSLKLKDILDDQELMDRVDLIIGPFYSDMFLIASRYAKEHDILIINPFTNRSDFLEGNPCVYKTMPSLKSHPKLLSQFLITENEDYNIILWHDDLAFSKEIAVYEEYFKEHDMPYQTVPFKAELTNLKSQLHRHKNNIIIVAAQSQATVISNFREMHSACSTSDSYSSIPSFNMIIPEVWIERLEAELDNLNLLQVYYFSNYFLDKKKENYPYFVSNYIEQFRSHPDLKRFSFQGYDITNYFVNCLLHEFDTSKFDFHPFSLDFEFYTQEYGGSENQKARLLQLKNYEITEIK